MSTGTKTGEGPQVPAVTVTLEYGDTKAGGRRQLQAVDGRIVEHRTV